MQPHFGPASLGWTELLDRLVDWIGEAAVVMGGKKQLNLAAPLGVSSAGLFQKRLPLLLVGDSNRRQIYRPIRIGGTDIQDHAFVLEEYAAIKTPVPH